MIVHEVMMIFLAILCYIVFKGDSSIDHACHCVVSNVPILYLYDLVLYLLVPIGPCLSLFYP